MSVLRSLFSLLFFFATVFVSIAQPINNIVGEYVPQTPNMAAMNQYTDIPVNHFTGVPNISIPVYTIQEGPITLPITLSYHGSGIKVAQMSSWVGLGWNLSCGGSVNRSIIDGMDDAASGYFFGQAQALVDSYGEGPVAYLEMHNAGVDKEPDIFYFNFGGYSGKMVYSLEKDNGAGGWYTYPRSDIKVEELPLGAVGGLDGFRFTTPEGVKYTFGLSNMVEKSHTHASSATPPDVFTTAWHLTKISSPDDKFYIEFHYVDEEYKYALLSSDQETTDAVDNGDVSCGGGSNTILRELYTHVETKRLSYITTSSNKVRVDFIADTDREDTEETHNLNAKRLDKIKISSTGAEEYCKEYRFIYSYSNSSATHHYEKRLVLDEFDEIICGSTSSSSGPPPYKFTYTGMNNVPSRLSKRIDHWGYYNNASANDNRTTLIPNTAYVDYDTTRIYFRDGDLNMTARRYANGSSLLYGSLAEIEYPTGGKTIFEFEPHTEYGVRDATNYSYLVQNSDSDCGGVNYIEGHTSMSEIELASAQCKIKIDLTGLGSCNCVTDRYAIQIRAEPFSDLGTNPDLPPEAYYRFRHTLAPSEACVYQFESEWIDINEFFSEGPIVAAEDTLYKYYIEPNDQEGPHWIRDAEVEFEIRYIPEDNQPIGGLRIKSITQDPVIGESIKTNYSYDDVNTGQSTGTVLIEPRYGYIFGQDAPDQFVLKHFTSTPVVSTADINGYTFGYEYVRQTRGDQITEYHFDLQKQVSTGFPVVALPPLYTNGTEKLQTIYANDGIPEIIAQNESFGEVLNYTPNGSYDITRKIHTITCVNDQSTYFAFIPSLDYTHIPSYYRLTSTINTLDDRSVTTYFAYDPAKKHTNVTEMHTSNSDNTSFITKYKYAPDLFANTHFLNEHNIVGIPLETTVNNGLSGGSKVEFSNTLQSGVILPHKFYNTKEDGSWKLQKEVLAVNSDGYPTRIKSRAQAQYVDLNWSTDVNKKGQLDQVVHGNRTTTYRYKNRLQLDSITNYDGVVSTFEYDNLERLSETSDRNGNRKMLYTYGYHHTLGIGSWVKSRATYTPTSGSDLVDKSSFQYFDGLGRLLQTVDQQHSPTQTDIVRAVKYDSLGRVTHQYEPFDAATTDGGIALGIPPGHEFTLTAYENSALNRILSVTPPDWHATTTSYGTNAENEIYDYQKNAFYPANSLIKTTVTDPNGNASISFQDNRGRTVAAVTEGNNNAGTAKTHYLFDNRDRLVHVLPPDKTLADVEEIYANIYDADDRLTSKKIPGRIPILYGYNDNDLVDSMKDGIHSWITYAYDSYERETFVRRNDTILVQKQYDNVSHGIQGIGKLDYELNLTTGERYISKSYIYDEFGRLDRYSYAHQLCAACPLKGTTGGCGLIQTFGYDYADNQIVKNAILLTCDGLQAIYTDSTTYDHSSRKSGNFFTVNGETRQLCSQTYTIKDELKQKKLGVDGGSFLQALDFDYLENGFLRQINQPLAGDLLTNEICQTGGGGDPTENNPSNDDLFYLELSYDQSIDDDIASQARLNGDISQMMWQTRGRAKSGYGFEYDFLDRLTKANYEHFDPSGDVISDHADRYDVEIQYENLLGDIGQLTRMGSDQDDDACGEAEEIDDLIYEYYPGTSKLKNIDDQADVANKGYPAYAVQDTGYRYDANGNITYDPSRKVTITYTRLNLPERIIFDDGRMILNEYDQEGNKLTQTTYMEHRERTVIDSSLDVPTGSYDYYYTTGPILGEQRDYIGEAELVNGAVQVIHHGDGRIVKKDGPSIAILPDTIHGDHYFYAGYIIAPTIILGQGNVLFEARDSIKLVDPFFVVEENTVDFEARIADVQVDTSWQWEYSIKDHLGNIRINFADLDGDKMICVALDSTNEILEEHSHYPFGMAHNGPWLKRKDRGFENKYNYNGKEEMPFTGYLYYGFRIYDPLRPGFLGADPISDQFPELSVYNYASNSPVSNIDLHGLQAVRATRPLNQLRVAHRAGQPVGPRINPNYNFNNPVATQPLFVEQKSYNLSGGNNAELKPTGSNTTYSGGGEWNDYFNNVIGPNIQRAVQAANSAGGAGGGDDGGDDGEAKIVDIGVHGNSKNSQKPQHGYEIVNENGEVLEYGISGQQRSSAQVESGGSPRINQKLRTKYNNDPNVSGRVIENNLGNRRSALEWEQGKVNEFDRINGHPPEQQRRPRPE